MNKDVKEKYYIFQILNQRLKEYQQQLFSLEQNDMELKELKENLNTIEDAKLEEDMFVSLGQGVFIKATLKDKELLINVGDSVLVKKTKMEGIKLIDDQIREIENVVENLKKEIERDINQIESLRKEIEKDNK